MKRLIVPPLPAASRPSNTTTSFWPVSLIQACAFSSSICSRRLVTSYSARRHPLVVRVALAPRLDRQAVGPDQHRIVDLVPRVVGRQAQPQELLGPQVAQRFDDVVELDDRLQVDDPVRHLLAHPRLPRALVGAYSQPPGGPDEKL